MKLWALAGLFAGLVATTLILKKRGDPPPEEKERDQAPERAPSKDEERYAVDDFVAEI